MSSTLNRGLNVKRTKHAICAFVTCAVMVALAGCGDSKQITEVKALPFGDANMTVAQALDNREVCDPKWKTSQDDHNRTVVEYDCNYKGINDSMFAKNGMDVASAGDTWQWTYGPDGTPSLTGVGLVIQHKDGTATTTNYGDIMVEALSKLIVDNKITNFDQAYSWLTNTRIPVLRPKESTKSISAIPDTTYGNKLAPFFPDQPPQDAAIHAYLQKGMPESVGTYGIDSLGYLTLKDIPEARATLYPVNPADVQIALKVNPYTTNESGIGTAALQLQDNKLVCLNELCYDANGHLVGMAPSEVVAKETSGATVDQYGAVTLNAQTQQATQAPSQQAMQQAVQQDTATHAQGSGAKVTMSTYGNVVASFFPGKPPLDAIQDALTSIHSELSVTDIAPSGYPEYQVECEANGQCVGGTGTSMGAAADVAKEMFPVNPADIGQGGVTCGQYICNDGKSNVIGRAPAAQ